MENNFLRHGGFVRTITTLLLGGLFVASPHESFAEPSRDDRLAEAAARGSYNFHVILEDRVLVSVENRIATLTGTTLDRDLAALAIDTVRELPHVAVVNNQLILDTSVPEYSDAWTVLKVRLRLLMRTGVDASRIRVKVVNQVATLEGFVGSADEKQLAGVYVGEMAAIREVKNELVVDAAVPAGAVAVVRVDDASISTLVKYALSSERLLAASQTKIATSNGAVTISGSAESEAEKARVFALVTTIRGVRSVTNNLVVRPPARE
jgi:hyperosmotically inducible protein